MNTTHHRGACRRTAPTPVRRKGLSLAARRSSTPSPPPAPGTRHHRPWRPRRRGGLPRADPGDPIDTKTRSKPNQACATTVHTAPPLAVGAQRRARTREAAAAPPQRAHPSRPRGGGRRAAAGAGLRLFRHGSVGRPAGTSTQVPESESVGSPGPGLGRRSWTESRGL
jgi:hypothetical protein